MSRDAGVIRDAAGLSRLLDLTEALTQAHGPSGPLVAARLTAACALERQESRGAHYRSDYPAIAAEAQRTLVTLEAGALSRMAA
jgi:L-aspartate oxidase